MKTWQTELYGTPMWLLQTFTATMVLLAISIYLIGKTRFGRQFWHVLRPCLDRKSSLHIIGFCRTDDFIAADRSPPECV